MLKREINSARNPFHLVTSIHKDITDRVERIDPELAKAVRMVLEVKDWVLTPPKAEAKEASLEARKASISIYVQCGSLIRIRA